MIASFNLECRRDPESFTLLGGHICTVISSNDTWKKIMENFTVLQSKLVLKGKCKNMITIVVYQVTFYVANS